MSLVTPTIVRSLFTQGQYFVFVGLGDGRFARYTLECPYVGDTGCQYRNIFSVSKVDVGTARPGKWQDYARRSGVGGAWSAVPDNGWAMVGGTEGEYIEWDIPDGHNRIHLITKNRSTYGDLTISWDDDTSVGLDLTTIDTAEEFWGVGASGIKEYVLATNSTATSRTLKILVVNAELCYVVGIHSFNTSGVGDPSTVNGTDSLAEGHDLVDCIDSSDTAFKATSLPVCGDMVNICADNTFGFVVIWAPDGGVKAVTATGSAHYSSADAPLTITTNPVLWIGGSSQGDMTSIVDIPLGEIHTDNQITILYAGGYGAFTSKTITGISAANPAVVTSAAHGFINGDTVRIHGVRGNMGDDVVNGNTYTVANKADNTFELAGCDTSGKTYTSYGKADNTAVALLGLAFTETFSPGGYGVAAVLNWTGDCDATPVYCPLLPFVSGLEGIAVFPPDTTKYPFTVGDTTKDYDQESNRISLLFKDKRIKVEMANVASVNHIWEQYEGTKLKCYCRIDPLSMPGGANPNAVQWAIGGTISIQDLTPEPAGRRSQGEAMGQRSGGF